MKRKHDQINNTDNTDNTDNNNKQKVRKRPTLVMFPKMVLEPIEEDIAQEKKDQEKVDDLRAALENLCS